ncbi:MAG: aromatic-ring-hydroxylating dioxygenase subunit beta [Candidatus Binatus sp.]|uniref:aromatic-ring-hydroxylating dioxygenase subunit beta n=1 Tax=Candidatus Binatus sp. TaxID=2811406 RepID=UPI00271DFFD3|nr:aromatic-ring-hydroxylating dioxygenase subunit beta [Candidatus Binatus sp.]MDO8432159.1 aromatic-ring-hydroxylating dioxygenase subunit beta [Candidatus Binatus sp.]
MTIDRSAVEALLYLEARLMDAHRYDEWLALWHDDATYWVPCNDDDIDPARNVSIIYDRRGQLRSRIQRLKETAWLREQTPRLRRVVSNIEIESATGAEVVVNSAFILAELHHHEQYLWAGSTTHKLAPEDGGLKIKYKKVVLLNNNEALPNLLFLI